MKSWVYWMEFFDNAQDYLCSPEDDYYKGSLWCMEEEEYLPLLLRLETQAVEACEQFSRSGKWPSMSDEVRFCAYTRVHNAGEICSHMCLLFEGKSRKVVIRPPNLEDFSHAEIVRWFLVDWWHQTAPDALKRMRT